MISLFFRGIVDRRGILELSKRNGAFALFVNLSHSQNRLYFTPGFAGQDPTPCIDSPGRPGREVGILHSMLEEEGQTDWQDILLLGYRLEHTQNLFGLRENVRGICVFHHSLLI